MKDMIKVNPNDMKQLVKDVALIKNILLNSSPSLDSEGELSDWAKEQLEDARVRVSKGDYISNEEILKEFVIE